MKLARAAGWRDSWLPSPTTRRRFSVTPIVAALASELSTPEVLGAGPENNAESLNSISSKPKKTTNHPMHNPSQKRSIVQWSSEDNRIFKEAADAGKSAKEIAKLLPGRTIHGIGGKLARYRSVGDSVFPSGPRRRWTPDEKAALLELRRVGVTVSGMQRYFPDRSLSSVSHAYHNLDQDQHKKAPRPACMRYSAEEDELLRALVARDVPHRLIGILLNRTLKAVGYRCGKIGVRSNIYWDPAKKAIHLQLSRDGLSHREIGMQLGKSYWGVVARSCRSREEADPANAIDKRVQEITNLTPEQMRIVGNLREQRLTWNAIQAQNFPKVTPDALLRAYMRLGGRTHINGAIRSKAALSTEMSPADVEYIQGLRFEGRSWREIGKMKYPNHHHSWVSKVFRRFLARTSYQHSEDAIRSESRGAS